MDGYSGFGSGLAINVTAINPSAADAAGAMISTTADLTRFYRALMDGRLLHPAQLALGRGPLRPGPDVDPADLRRRLLQPRR